MASDRISAYDVILETPIPDKGAILTQLTLWWYDQLDGVVNHVVSTDVPASVEGRGVLVRRLEMVPDRVRRPRVPHRRRDSRSTSAPVPCRGWACRRGWWTGPSCRYPIFTPTTKAPLGEHDQPLSPEQVRNRIGPQLAARVDVLTRRILARGNEVAAESGIIIADTKLEFGVDRENLDHTGGPTVVLADEVLTPDSSRFWPVEQWEPGRPQPSFDKQFVRDWLVSPESGWDRSSGEPPPPLPDAIVEQTRDRYVQAFEKLTGRAFSADGYGLGTDADDVRGRHRDLALSCSCLCSSRLRRGRPPDHRRRQRALRALGPHRRGADPGDGRHGAAAAHLRRAVCRSAAGRPQAPCSSWRPGSAPCRPGHPRRPTSRTAAGWTSAASSGSPSTTSPAADLVRRRAARRAPTSP